MATGSTPNYFLSYPLSTDPVNVASDIEDLAANLDSFLTTPIFINDVRVDGGDLTTTALTATVFNANATTLSVGQAATTVYIGETTGTTTIRNANTVVTGDLAVNGGDITTSQTTFNLINATATTLNIGAASTTTNIGNASGQTNFAGDINIATGKVYEINNVSVLSSTTLGSSVITSSLTSVGTIATGTWNATTISVDKGGTGLTSYAIGDIIYASGATTLAKLADIATGNALISGGVGVAPSYGKIGLTTHVSGTLPVANGGTGVTTSTGTGNVVLSASPTFTGTVVVPLLSLTTADTVTAASHYLVEIASDGILRPKTLANVITEIVTTAAVNSAAATTVGTITSGTWDATDISLASGGTNASLTAINGGAVYSTGTAMAITSAGTLGQVLTSNGSSAPTWETPTSGGGTIGLESVLMFAGM
jgi:hypothetical protein